MKKRRVTINQQEVEDVLRRCMKYMDGARAIKVFDAGFNNMDPEAERLARWISRIGCLFFGTVIVLGSISGLVVLVRMAFW